MKNTCIWTRPILQLSNRSKSIERLPSSIWAPRWPPINEPRPLRLLHTNHAVHQHSLWNWWICPLFLWMNRNRIWTWAGMAGRRTHLDSITHQAASNIIARLLPYLSFILLKKAWHNLTHTHIYTNTQTHSYPPRLCWVVGIRVFFVRAQNHCTSVRVCPPPNPWNPWKLEPASKSSPMRCSNLANFPGYVKTFKHLPCHFELGNGN